MRATLLLLTTSLIDDDKQAKSNCRREFNYTTMLLFIYRQENLGLQARYNAMEHRSKDVLFTQSGALSGANVALVSLSGRLEHLVEQLISTYNISERDLEVS